MKRQKKVIEEDYGQEVQKPQLTKSMNQNQHAVIVEETKAKERAERFNTQEEVNHLEKSFIRLGFMDTHEGNIDSKIRTVDQLK